MKVWEPCRRRTKNLRTESRAGPEKNAAGALRHEEKHEISPMDCVILRSRLRAALHADPHGDNGRYRVRSLYFDNADDKVLREKLEGAPYREKFRIRFYQGECSMLHLEKKSKLIRLCAKLSEPMRKPCAVPCRAPGRL